MKLGINYNILSLQHNPKLGDTTVLIGHKLQRQ